MKTAVVCDWLVTYAGSERVLEQILACFPDADIFAVVDFLPEEFRAFLRDKKIQTTFIQKMPFAKKYYRHYLPLMPYAVEQLDLSSYELVISSSHAVAKGIITHPEQYHISYVHSPMRYAWDLQHQYLRESGLDKGFKGTLAKWLLHKMRLWDQRTANGVDHFISNSQFIAERIWKTYRREATVIYPPIDHQLFTPHRQKEDFYLTASRFVPYKKIDLIVEAFTHMPNKKLVVIGDGPDMKKIKRKAYEKTGTTTNNSIEILGYLPNKQLVSYMQRAKAFIFAAEEDFGLIPLEAQACATPVIAYGKGGSLETVRGLDKDKPTGVFFPQQSIDAIKQAITEFESDQAKITYDNLISHAAQFSIENFKKQFKNFVFSMTG